LKIRQQEAEEIAIKKIFAGFKEKKGYQRKALNALRLSKDGASKKRPQTTNKFSPCDMDP